MPDVTLRSGGRIDPQRIRDLIRTVSRIFDRGSSDRPPPNPNRAPRRRLDDDVQRNFLDSQNQVLDNGLTSATVDVPPMWFRDP